MLDRELPSGHAGTPRPRTRRPPRPQRAAGHHPPHRLRPDRAVRQPSRLRLHRRGDVGLRGDRRRARRRTPLLPPIALTDEVDRTGRSVRDHGRPALRRRPGRRRQPARVAVPAHGSADLGLPADRASSSPAWVRASRTPCLGAPTAAPTALGRPVDVVGLGRRSGDAAHRGRRRLRGSRPSPDGSSTAKSSTRWWLPGSRPGRCREVLDEFAAAEAAIGRSWTWPPSPPTRTWRRRA